MSSKQLLEDLLEKVDSLMINTIDEVKAKNKHLDSRLYQHTVSEAGGYYKAIHDVRDLILERYLEPEEKGKDGNS